VAKNLAGRLYPVDRRSNTLYWQEGEFKTRLDKQAVRSRVPLIEELMNEFLREHPGSEIETVTGNENLFYNAPIVTLIGDKIYYAIGEDVQARNYPMYVVWPDGRNTIEENVTFRFLGEDKQRVRVYVDGNTASVNYATVVQLIKNEKGFVYPNPQNGLAYFYDDIKHLFSMPFFGYEHHGVSGLMCDGIFFMADQFLTDKTRINRYFAEPFTKQEFNLTAALIDRRGRELEGGWKIAPDLLRDGLSKSGYVPDDFEIDSVRNVISIRLKESVYPFHIVGVTQSGKVKEIVVEGLSGRIGVSIREAAKLSEKEGLVKAGIVDQGLTVRLDVDGEPIVKSMVDAADPLGPHATSLIVYVKKNNQIRSSMGLVIKNQITRQGFSDLLTDRNASAPVTGPPVENFIASASSLSLAVSFGSKLMPTSRKSINLEHWSASSSVDLEYVLKQ
jgi:hypothetical protein